MFDNDDFEPWLGRGHARGGHQGRKFLHRVLAATNLARGGGAATGRRGHFDGSRIGRGAGVGRILASRDHFSAFRQRRVIIKSRIVKLAGKGFTAARAHLRYVERDGTTRDGGRGRLYDARRDMVDGKAFLERGQNDRHQFRFIVSAEDGAEYDDLKPLARRLMAQMEEDLGTKLDWVAVDHFNTGHPHTHVIVRGKDDRGKDLIIAREYLTGGMRERAAELVNLDLGPRSLQEIRQKLMGEIEQDRLTSIDRALVRDAGSAGLVSAASSEAFEQSLRMGRLRKLARMGLAAPIGTSQWRLAPDIADTLRRMGERGDIIRTMQRAFAARGKATALADQMIYDPSVSAPLIGRIVERGLSDELEDRHYLIVEATDGRSHYVEIGKSVPDPASGQVESYAEASIVRITPTPVGVRAADRTIVAVAAANGGHYDVDAHLRHDPSATEAFAETHMRRLEAMRRLTRNVTRDADGRWTIAPDHLERVAAYEAVRAKDRPVFVEALSRQPLEILVAVDAATWLDRELLATAPVALRDVGFGAEVRTALTRRRQWLVAQGFADDAGGHIGYHPGMIEALRRRELLRIGAQLSSELGIPFVETGRGDRVSGVLQRSVEAMSGRYALVEQSREFTLVPWRPVLDRHLGKSVAGLVRSDGISWSIGRDRGGPSLS